MSVGCVRLESEVRSRAGRPVVAYIDCPFPSFAVAVVARGQCQLVQDGHARGERVLKIAIGGSCIMGARTEVD